MKPTIVFDLNETLLDMSALDPAFARIFSKANGSAVRKAWFSRVSELFLTIAITGEYRSFDKLTDDALQMTAAAQHGEVSADDRAILKQALGEIPPHPDVRPGLEQLKEGGFTIATLTNSTARAATTLIERAGLRDLFDAVLSVDAIQHYKPSREAYAYAAAQLRVNLGDIVLVAAHDWDIAGAMAAGATAAFVQRPEKVLSAGRPMPQFQSPHLQDLCEQIVATYR
ncbi:MAG: haloacid dehalogenase type II [Gemmatimonadota bacterium]|nr:haloacid dehalogenase type II [Gemmatimonadota bacterium]